MISKFLPGFSLLIAIIALSLGAYSHNQQQKVAYVETDRLLHGFTLSAKVQAEIDSAQAKAQSEIQRAGDSLAAFKLRIETDYANKPVAERAKREQVLVGQVQAFGQFREASARRLAQLRADKLQGMADKVNVFLAEFGNRNGYAVIFATVNGNIAYGDTEKMDITDEVVRELNRQFQPGFSK
jgi:outer membrane protein